MIRYQQKGGAGTLTLNAVSRVLGDMSGSNGPIQFSRVQDEVPQIQKVPQ